MEITAATFTAADVMRATGVSSDTLQNWLKRNVVIGHRTGQAKIEGGGSQGKHRRFSFFNVMEIALAQVLTQAGASDLATAFRAAAAFAHSGTGPSGWVGEAPSGKAARFPGHPFADGYSLLCVSGDRTAVVQWMPGTDVLATIRQVLASPGVYIIVEANDVFDRVVAALGYDTQAVLDEAYAEGEAN